MDDPEGTAGEVAPAEPELYGPLRPCPAADKDALRKFVEGVLTNQIFLLQYVQDSTLVGSVFMAVGLGGFGGIDPITIGTIYERYDKAGPRSINGYPMFFGCHFLNVEDWNKCREIIIREQEKRASSLEDAFGGDDADGEVGV